MVPPLHRYHEALRLPVALPGPLRCLREAGTVRVLLFVPDGQEHAARGPGIGKPVPRPALCERRRRDLPGSWGTPVNTCPGLGPRRDPRARPLPRSGAAFRAGYGVGSRDSPFGAASHGPRPRCLRFAGWVAPPPRKTRFRLPACFAGRISYPQGSVKGFSSRVLLPQASPGAKPVVLAGRGKTAPRAVFREPCLSPLSRRFPLR
jgi:hypothetical protein